MAERAKFVAKFIGAGSPQEIIFTKNTTEGINLVARGLNWQAGERVLVSDREHNSNLIIWQVLQKERGIELFVLPSKNDETFDLAGLEARNCKKA